jgi:hypothetical protein
MPFNRFLQPDYSDGIEAIRRSITGNKLPSARFVSLLVHGSRDGDAQVTMLLAQWGQFIDHDMTATAQPRSINGSIPRCCDSKNPHPTCLPIKVPRDDPWLAPVGLRCLEFLRSAPSQRPDCVLSWREQTNQATSYLDASAIYSSNPRMSDNARIFRDGLLLFGRGISREDACLRGALANQCIRPGDTRSGEQPGLLGMHTVWVGEHNRITTELADLNSHWSDEKLYQETRRIVGAMVQHITYREFLPMVLGKEVTRLFDLELKTEGYYGGYDPRVNPTVANSFGAAAFRFGHSLVQGSFIRCDRNHRVLDNNVSLHEEFSRGDTGGPGSLHRLLRGMASQRSLKRDEFITAELTNHLFQTGSFPFGLDLAAINIQRGRDHGLPSYTSWRHPCGLSDVLDWNDFEKVVGPQSTERIRQAYLTVDDVDLFVGGLAERPVIGGIVGPTFACIIAQQFSNARKGDRFWYENPGFESSFTPAQLQSLRQVTLAQVLCRALGGGTLQPNVFLPHDFPGNDRRLCGVGAMGAIDLLPWTERDPFNKNRETVSFPFKPQHTVTIIDDSQNQIADKIDFDDSDTIPKTGKLEQKIDTKLDFGGGVTTKRPNTRPSANIKVRPNLNINNKLDLKHKTTKSPSLNNHKLDLTKPKPGHIRNTRNTTTPTTKAPKRATITLQVRDKNKTKKPRRKNTNQNNDRTIDTETSLNDKSDTVFEGRASFSVSGFHNEDNATGYFDNKAVTLARYKSKDYEDEYEEEPIDSDVHVKRILFSTPEPESYNVEIKIRPNRPTKLHTNFDDDYINYNNDRDVDYKLPSVTYRPTNWLNTRRPQEPSTQYPPYQQSTPFSYDTTTRPPVWSTWKYPNRIPINTYPNDVHYNSPTTRPPQLQTFLFVDTTKRTTSIPIFTTSRPYYDNYYNNKQNGQNSYRKTQADTEDYDYTTYAPILNDNYNADFKLDGKLQFDLDGYMRPNMNSFYQPNGNATERYINYDINENGNLTNLQSRYRSSDEPTNTTFNDDYVLPIMARSSDSVFSTVQAQSTRFPNGRPKPQTKVNDKMDEIFTDALPRIPNFDIPSADYIDDVTNDNIFIKTETKDTQVVTLKPIIRTTTNVPNTNKQKRPEILIVPIKLLTKPDRPDNWVMFDAPTKKPLPEMPIINNQKDLISSEIPKPMNRLK